MEGFAKMSDTYQIGKDIKDLQNELETTARLVNELYSLISYNLTKNILKEPEKNAK